MEKVHLLAIGLSLSLLLFVLHLIRRRYLREQYSLLWLFFCVIIIVFSLNSKLLDSTARLLGFAYAPSLLFLVGITLCLLLILHLTVVVSKLAERTVRLTQELGLIRHELEKYEQRTGKS